MRLSPDSFRPHLNCSHAPSCKDVLTPAQHYWKRSPQQTLCRQPKAQGGLDEHGDPRVHQLRSEVQHSRRLQESQRLPSASRADYMDAFSEVPDPGTKGAQKSISKQNLWQHCRDTLTNRRLLVAITLSGGRLCSCVPAPFVLVATSNQNTAANRRTPEILRRCSLSEALPAFSKRPDLRLPPLTPEPTTTLAALLWTGELSVDGGS